MKTHYSAKELAELGCVNGSSERNIKRLAQKENWVGRKRQGKGGGLEYAFDGLPKKVQAEIKARELKALMVADIPKAVMVRGERDIDSLNHKQRRIADSRMLMAMLVERYADELGTQDKAIKHVSKLSRIGALPIEGATDYNTVCENAKARAGKVGVGVRNLHEWVIEARRCGSASEVLAVMSPNKQGRPKMNVLSALWLPDFLKIYRNPNGLSVSRCYELWRYEHIKAHGTDLGLPSLTQVRAMLKRIPLLERERGRITGSKLKEIDSYTNRT
ncbi:DNA-binding protein, partial [Moraxella equi]